ncbi:MAG: DUF6655 family protein [Pirellulaceae bacterium]
MIVPLHKVIGISLVAVALAGCGTTKSRRATEQLLMSDAVDRSVASIDFRPLSGLRVYLDTTYVKNIPGQDFVNADYIVSSVRQQMVGAGCLLVETLETAEYVAEMRVGTLGTDSHELVYGLPANNALSSAASLVPSAPTIPVIPEISVARKGDERGAAKIALFAYHKSTRRPVWQSGMAQAHSSSKDTWVFGAGPFKSGTIHEGTEFAGGELAIPLLSAGDDDVTGRPDPLAIYSHEATYVMPASSAADGQTPAVQPANFESPVPDPGAAPAVVPPAPAAAAPAAAAPTEAAPAAAAPADAAPTDAAPAAEQ